MVAAAQTPLFSREVPYVSPADVDVHALSVPARMFTGDFYLAHRQGDSLWLALGDVAGKGLDAALFMAVIQEELEHRIASCSRSGCDPAVTMARLHAVLRPLLPRNRFASAVLAVLHDDGTLVAVNAGHLPALIAREDGSIDQIDSTGPVLGMLPSSRWNSMRRVLLRGETLLLYTDGVVEAPDADGEEFGADRLRSVFSAEVTRPAADSRSIAASIAEAARRHANGARADDLTVMVARRRAS
jgi:phosphoserine phosphatase RsbU/P